MMTQANEVFKNTAAPMPDRKLRTYTESYN